MPHTVDPYELFYPATSGDVLPYDEYTAMVQALAVYLTQLAEAVGVSGCWSATDFNGTIIPGSLAVEISAGRAWIGSAGARKLVYGAAPEILEDGIGGIVIAPSTTNYVFLLQDGTWEVNTTGTPPADSELAISFVTDATEATSIDDAPTGRTNLGPVMTTLRHLADAEPGALSIGGSGSAGTSTQAAREDHTHDMPAAAAPVATGATNAEGAATTFARSDHTHAIGSGSVDGTTLEVNSGAARIKDAGVSAAKIATDAVVTAKIQDSAVSANKLATDAVTTGKILNASVTSAKLADAVQDAIGGAPALSVAAESSDARQVTIQARDLAGNNLAERRLVRVWIADSDFGAEASTPPDGGVTIDTGTGVQTVTADKQLVILSNASGQVQVTLTESTIKTFYLMAEVAGVVASAAVAFA